MLDIVLDKSGLQAAPFGFLPTTREEYRLIIVPALVQECFTNPTDKGRCSDKVFSETSGLCTLDMGELLSWEMALGLPASLTKLVPISKPDLTEQQLKDLLIESRRQEEDIAKDLSMSLQPDEAGWLHDHQLIQGKRAFFEQLAASIDAGMISERARRRWGELASKKGIPVSEDFAPSPGWFSYGVQLMSDALFYLKFWRVGNGTLEPDKPANPMFDVFYGAFVSLFDGILSCDPDLLNLVWACYRDKRKNILTYSSAKKAIVQYEPPWQS